MEELKNENVTEQPVAEEPVVEQRPSTKYGRTAYQQQMQEEQPQQEQQNAYEQETVRPYQQYQQDSQSYQSQYSAYTPYEEQKPAVKNVLAYVLMVLVAVSMMIDLVASMMTANAFSMGDTLEEIMDATLLLAQEPAMLILSSVNDVLFWVTVGVLVFDIIQLHKAGKKIVGAILFAIFLRPAYFIWRAHLLGQKKAGAIIYTVVVYMVSFAQYYVALSASMDWVYRTML